MTARRSRRVAEGRRLRSPLSTQRSRTTQRGRARERAAHVGEGRVGGELSPAEGVHVGACIFTSGGGGDELPVVGGEGRPSSQAKHTQVEVQARGREDATRIAHTLTHTRAYTAQRKASRRNQLHRVRA